MHVWVQVVDMPLLYETGAHRVTRPNLLVMCSPEVQVGQAWPGRKHAMRNLAGNVHRPPNQSASVSFTPDAA